MVKKDLTIWNKTQLRRYWINLHTCFNLYSNVNH